jgi:hypothetical protein
MNFLKLSRDAAVSICTKVANENYVAIYQALEIEVDKLLTQDLPHKSVGLV